MNEAPPEFGKLRTTHQPSTVKIWFYAAGALVFLLPVLLEIAIAVETLKQGGSTQGQTFSPIICMGGLGFFILLFLILLRSEFRKWSPTRGHKVRIFENGFDYERDGQLETCGWDDIQRIDYRTIEVVTKTSRRRVSVIRSVIKRDGSVISFVETLDLEKLTGLIKPHANSTHSI